MHSAEGTRIELKGKVPFSVDIATLDIPEEPKVMSDELRHPVCEMCDTGNVAFSRSACIAAMPHMLRKIVDVRCQRARVQPRLMCGMKCSDHVHSGLRLWSRH